MKSIAFILLFFALTFEAGAQQTNSRQPRDESRQRGGGGDRSPILAVLDSNGDRELSGEELANAASALKKLDRNEDGRLDEGEFKVSATRQSGRGGSTRPPASGGDRPRTPWILVHALEIDANEDGVVEFESEMMAEANRVFAAYDRNNDEKITPDESGSKKGIPKSALGGFVREHAVELDRDNDGGISKAEMIGQFAKFFTQADRNGDQKLTKDEYEVEGGVVPRFPERANNANRPGPRNESSASRMRPAPPEARSPANRPASPPRKPDGDLPDRPNIVLFLIDDMGWNAMGFTGNPWIETPRTDAMARQGMIFTNAYASAPNCAPTVRNAGTSWTRNRKRPGNSSPTFVVGRRKPTPRVPSKPIRPTTRMPDRNEGEISERRATSGDNECRRIPKMRRVSQVLQSHSPLPFPKVPPFAADTS